MVRFGSFKWIVKKYALGQSCKRLCFLLTRRKKMDSKLNPQTISEQARKEIEAQNFRVQVDIEKARIARKRRRSIWAWLFPWRITRVDEVDHYDEFCRHLKELRKDGLIIDVRIASQMGGIKFFIEH
jgi:hypothetical protein